MARRKSIIPNDSEYCRLCGYPYTEIHHALHGTANRKKSDQDGLTVHLCSLHHRLLHDSPEWRGYDRELQKTAQLAWMEHYGTLEDFRKRYGKSYL